jgi:hypothetical protein
MLAVSVSLNKVKTIAGPSGIMSFNKVESETGLRVYVKYLVIDPSDFSRLTVDILAFRHQMRLFTVTLQ